ncbi:MAG TPA: ParB/RepB/Spo0J family partition protein [Syntrophomonadaceae bacterium]|nr:ParB/RepB/Spo0J family partition protein [Syntrophomonadaceae bacterium]
MKNKGLGRGLRALIPTVPEGAREVDEIVELPLDKIEPGPFQARQDFDEESLSELAASIKTHGVMQPVVVRPLGDDRYQLVVGERRWRACRQAGLQNIPAVIRRVDDLASSEMMLIENVQRKDLNPLEEAQAYKRLIEEFGLTQDEISRRVGKSRPFIANTLRLLQLPPEVQALMAKGFLSAGHGKVLLGLSGPEQQSKLAEEIVRRGLSVRDTEKEAQRLQGAKKASKGARQKKDTRQDLELADLEERLRKLLGTKVRIKTGRRGGRIEIEFYSRDELARLLEWFMGGLT